MSEWISVKDRLPQSEGSSVLAYDANTSSQFTAYIRRCRCKGCPAHWYYFGQPASEQEIEEVTHWMPLPPKPESNKMAVFYDTGGGDIYAGPTKEAVIAAMKADSSDIDESEIFEVPGTSMMRMQDENGPTDQFVSLADEYGDDDDAYCIAS